MGNINQSLADLAVSARSWSLCGKRVAIGVNAKTRLLVVVPIRCKSWRCPTCRPKKVALWKHRVIAGHPERFITLTKRPEPFTCTNDDLAIFQKQLTILFRLIRKKFKDFEYVRVFEQTKTGNLHCHIAQRGSYIPQRWLSNAWDKISGSPVVDIRKIRGKHQAAGYITKYLVKSIAALTLAARGHRVIALSQKWTIDHDTYEMSIDTKDYVWSATPLPYYRVVEEFASIGSDLADYDPETGILIMNLPPSCLTAMSMGVLDALNLKLATIL